MKGSIIVPPPPMAHSNDPAWGAVGNVIEVEINEYNRHLIIESARGVPIGVDDEDLQRMTRQFADDIDQGIVDNILEEDKMSDKEQLDVRIVVMGANTQIPPGKYATIPWEQWKRFVDSLHDLELCVAPQKNGESNE